NNNVLYINPIGASMSGTYTLLTYTGSLTSPFSGAQTVAPSRYAFTLNTVAGTPNQVNLVVTPGSGSPASLIWNNAANNGNWDTDISQNWLNQSTSANDYFFSQDSVTFDDSIISAANPTTSISIPGLVIPNIITNNSTTNYTFSGAGKISGGARIVKLGSSTLTINTTNDFTGSVTVQGGTIVQGTNYAFGSSTGTLFITNTGTVDMDGITLGSKPVIVSGAGVNANGAIINSGSSSIFDNGSGLTAVTLAGDATFGEAPTRWDLGNSTGGTLSTGGHAYNVSVTGNAVGSASGAYMEWNDLTIDAALANINILSGELGVKGMTSLGNPASTVTIYSGGQLTFWSGSGYAKNYDVKSGGTILVRQTGPAFNLNMTLEGGSTFSSLDLAKVITGTVSLPGLAHFKVANAACTFSNMISGVGGFYMDSSDSNPLVFTATNTYSGPTLLTNSGSGAVLVLTNNGSISSSSPIALASGAILDVGGRTDKTLTLASLQTLEGIGTVKGNVTASSGSTLSPGLSGLGTLTVTNAVTLQGITSMSVGSGFNNLLNATNISYGGSLSLSFTPGSLAAGNSFKLFNAGTYSGSFASISPSSPGTGLYWDTTQLTVSGTLRVGVLPQISNIVVSGTSLSISGTGTPSGTYHVRTSTNAGALLASWTVLGGGSFDGTGHATFNGSVNPAEPERFYILVEP
ncbi:MAG TPA: hypothetical protein VFC07_11365, partial [Verrucomicrobiae bacterium]|nr:hypothetical protein [Verrucomicrobiae bacterium]